MSNTEIITKILLATLAWLYLTNRLTVLTTLIALTGWAIIHQILTA